MSYVCGFWLMERKHANTILSIVMISVLYFYLGWRPKRTIIIAHWDAEEQGVIGSWEWVQVKVSRYMVETSYYFTLCITQLCCKKLSIVCFKSCYETR